MTKPQLLDPHTLQQLREKASTTEEDMLFGHIDALTTTLGMLKHATPATTEVVARGNMGKLIYGPGPSGLGGGLTPDQRSATMDKPRPLTMEEVKSIGLAKKRCREILVKEVSFDRSLTDLLARAYIQGVRDVVSTQVEDKGEENGTN